MAANSPNSDQRKAIQLLYTAHYDALMRYGFTICGDKEKTHDCIQELFLWLLRNPQKLEGIKKPRVYLISALKRNIGQLSKREEGKNARHKSFQSNLPDIPSVEENRIKLETEEEKIQLIRKQLAALPSRQRELLLLRYYENLSYDELEEVLQQSKQVLRNTVSRAIQSLKRLVNPEKISKS